MYNLTEQSVHRLLHAAIGLRAALVSSPLWDMLKDEPVVVELSTSIEEIEKQVNQNEAQV